MLIPPTQLPLRDYQLESEGQSLGDQDVLPICVVIGVERLGFASTWTHHPADRRAESTIAIPTLSQVPSIGVGAI
jgi:hypothetical protein